MGSLYNFAQVIFLSLELFTLSQASSKERVIVLGQIMCDGKPYSGATVKLFNNSKHI